jgi:hypothetical protein
MPVHPETVSTYTATNSSVTPVGTVTVKAPPPGAPSLAYVGAASAPSFVADVRFAFAL